MTKPRYPDIHVQLTGQDTFAVLGAVIKAMKEHGVPTAERKAFYEQATRGDYDHLLRVCMHWVDVRDEQS